MGRKCNGQTNCFEISPGMPNDLDQLLASLKRQRTDVETEMNSTRERDAAELVEKFASLRKRSEELDETCRRQNNPLPRSSR